MSTVEAMRPLTALLALMVITSFWVMASKNDIISNHPRAYYMLTGTIFSNITCRLVVAQMSGSRCSAWNPLLNVCLLVVFLALTLPFLESLLLYLLWAFVTYAHIHYGTCVVRQLCGHFRIECFRIATPNK
uniref:Ethanolaminephosphotransferase 1 n=1 Tax=Triatoma infestans TaxID=30076 RepID=A0A171A9W3_TRIIF